MCGLRISGGASACALDPGEGQAGLLGLFGGVGGGDRISYVTLNVTPLTVTLLIKPVTFTFNP